MLTDSHCHLDQLDLTLFNNDLQTALDHAASLDVSRFLCVCIDLNNLKAVLEIANRYPAIYASIGLHPCDCFAAFSAADLLPYINEKKVIAIGETGLDYYRDSSKKEIQQHCFALQIALAKQYKKPLIVHTRAAQSDTIHMLRTEKADEIAGVMHCFTEDWEMAKKALDLGFYISISGIVTFKNALQIQEVAKKTPLDRLLVETDSPYLAPVPHRGKPNQPAYVRYVAEYIANLRQISFETLAVQTSKNFDTLFMIA